MDEHVNNSRQTGRSHFTALNLTRFVAFFAFALLGFNLRSFTHWLGCDHRTADLPNEATISVTRCIPPLPDVISYSPPSGSEPSLKVAFENLQLDLEHIYQTTGMESLSIAIITRSASIYENFQGVRLANESSPSRKDEVNRHSIYRIASLSKLFTTIETLILKDRGLLSLDDPITRFISEFSYRPGGFTIAQFNAPKQNNDNWTNEPITIRHLASHTSGIGHDVPRVNNTQWPKRLGNHMRVANPRYLTTQELIESISANRLTVPPSTYPLYSNVGPSIQGLINVAADAQSRNGSSPLDHTDLLARDIFIPLGMNGSSFNITKQNVKHLVFPSVVNGIEVDALNPLNPSIGQFSSLSDLVNATRSLLLSSSSLAYTQRTLLSPLTMREWLKPSHLWVDGVTMSGLTWEIQNYRDRYGRVFSSYGKTGGMKGFGSAMVLFPQHYFGLAFLFTGSSPIHSSIIESVTHHITPAFQTILENRSQEMYAGNWTTTSNGEKSEARVEVRGGSLWLDTLIVGGLDVLSLLRKESPAVPLWSTGREGEFRIPYGAGNAYRVGCESSWGSIDMLGDAQGYPLDLLLFERATTSEGPLWELSFPSAGIRMRRSQL